MTQPDEVADEAGYRRTAAASDGPDVRRQTGLALTETFGNVASDGQDVAVGQEEAAQAVFANQPQLFRQPSLRRLVVRLVGRELALHRRAAQRLEVGVTADVP